MHAMLNVPRSFRQLVRFLHPSVFAKGIPSGLEGSAWLGIRRLFLNNFVLIRQ